MGANFAIEVQGQQDLFRSFDKLYQGVTDFRPLWPAHKKIRFRFQREHMEDEGASTGEKWRPLSENYRKKKEEAVGDKPILQYTGHLFLSLTEEGAPDNITEETATEFIEGTLDPKALKHQEGDGVPERPVIRIGTEEVRAHDLQLFRGVVEMMRRARFGIE